MENGSFHNLRLSEFDFVDPKEKARSPQSSQSPIKSETVEALISQNEDLMARLKITLRRMTSLEEEHRLSQEEMKDLKVSYSATQDQLLIWKEKERLWKEKLNQLENENLTFKTRFPDYQRLEYQLERYKRYQEKVKSTIKPYLQQLKDYAKSLHLQIQSLNGELYEKDAQILNNEKLIENLKEEKEQLARFYEMNQSELVEGQERMMTSLKKEIESLTQTNAMLELKAQSLDRALERQDELENLVIALRRSKEEYQNEIQNRLQNLEESNRSLKLQTTELQLTMANAQQEATTAQEALHREKSARFQLEEQLSSLRFMWNKKCEEFDKLKFSMEALENLNHELSQSLNKYRAKS